MIRSLGVRGRLLLAFFGISAFAVFAAAAALYSFLQVGRTLDRITAQRLPPVLASLQLSGQVERIVAAAPALLTVTSATQHEPLSRTIATEVQELNRLVAELEKEDLARPAVPQIKSVVTRLRVNLDALNTLVANRLAARQLKRDLLGELSGAHIATQRLLTTGIAVMDAKIANARRTVRGRLPLPLRRSCPPVCRSTSSCPRSRSGTSSRRSRPSTTLCSRRRWSRVWPSSRSWRSRCAGR